MLYIFDLGNVIVDIDFKRVLGVWSKLSSVPLATLNERFTMGEVFQQHERGEISDEDFAHQLSDEMGISLSFEQFAEGWQAIFVALRPEVIDIMNKLRREGNRVVVLSNTNRLHCYYWPEHYPEVAAAADHMYLSQDLGMRKPEARIYQHVLNAENVPAEQAVFFDDVEANVLAAKAVGINAIHVTDRQIIPTYFSL
ncbi:glucose-1-phosphatase [Yersinia pestis]|uniref:Phosphatase n=11 Tax=Yersinia pseudotuberculosis complex TaxID=1649845 RepID=A0AAX2HV03_YERPE|nr:MULTISPECIES: glucose-1-phosphatase [Yersinia pseudotuberculosis complex]EDR34356.1 HAD hydrolase, IA family [Yersinia pestis biovar Orientalis str. IP275]EFA47319.1 HAD hydrolase, family IA, variant 3 [Yersinia pestis KIM D27]ERP76252.1 alpha-D-glucose-1-phosphatase [Yersinia pestis S3]ERP76879.1 alpha-D-glucose-1-phosphatase [Yersinia pestis 24H]CQD58012.1 alpha-D-glucose-1-phosphatase [Yersinia intermedia]